MGREAKVSKGRKLDSIIDPCTFNCAVQMECFEIRALRKQSEQAGYIKDGNDCQPLDLWAWWQLKVQLLEVHMGVTYDEFFKERCLLQVEAYQRRKILGHCWWKKRFANTS